MAKKNKTDNQFGPTTGTATATETKAPGDETPKVKTKKDGTPFKVRGPSGPHTVNPKIVKLIAEQATDLALFKANQRTAKRDFMRTLHIESESAKMVARLEKKLLDMTPAEKAWMVKATAEKLAAAGAPELEQHP